MVNLRVERDLLFRRKLKIYVIDLEHWPVIPEEHDIVSIEFADGWIRCHYGTCESIMDAGYVTSVKGFENLLDESGEDLDEVWTTNRSLAEMIAKLVNDRRAEKDGYV